MKNKFLLFVCSFLLVPALQLHSQVVVSNREITGVCYAGTKVNRMYVPPPKDYFQKRDSKGGGTIIVNYTGFTTEAKRAVEFAASILEAMLPSDTRITVNALCTQISNTGVLGNSRITGFAGGWAIDALHPYAFYPVTVAEKIAGEKLNTDAEGDIELVLNSTTNWYLGTDGNTPVQRYDLVTVVLHELCHGLGFFDSMSVTGSTGTYGIGPFPLIYDTFVENLNEKRLTDTLLFSRNTTALYRELTGGQLYFDGPLSTNYLKGTRARLYAPSSYDEGSSVSHLDESRTLPVNALMTPYIDFGEAIHDPGRLTMSILGDIGWINTKIIHDELKDTESLLQEIEITARIKSDTLYNKNRVGLVYSYDGFQTDDTLYMTETTKDFFRQKIQVPSYNSMISYYLFATDTFDRQYKLPSVAGRLPFSVFIGSDTLKPLVSHQPETYYFEKADSVVFIAAAVDNVGIDTVYVEVKVNDKASFNVGLKAKGRDIFRTAVSLKSLSVGGGDSIRYSIVAVDKAALKNTRRVPSSGFYKIDIENLALASKSYSTNFESAGNDFFNKGFEILRPAGFSGSALHSEHPYKSPEEDDVTMDFSSVLRVPVIFDQSGMVIEFREIVLVEPGAEGSVYGFYDFYDYVVIEASSDFGRSWFSLADGYDSRINASWEEAYNSIIVGQNSGFTAEETMFNKHAFYPRLTGRVSSGDTLLIRFRLFSDPYANGWGWVIDDLKISPLVTGIEQTSSHEIKVYPNPGEGQLTLDLGGEELLKNASFNLFNSSGICLIRNEKLTNNKTAIDISRFPPGLYFIIVMTENGLRTIKYSLTR